MHYCQLRFGGNILWLDYLRGSKWRRIQIYLWKVFAPFPTTTDIWRIGILAWKYERMKFHGRGKEALLCKHPALSTKPRWLLCRTEPFPPPQLNSSLASPSRDTVLILNQSTQETPPVPLSSVVGIWRNASFPLSNGGLPNWIISWVGMHYFCY